jgi:sodium-dependent dicarboxylate transporter 2/3/5
MNPRVEMGLYERIPSTKKAASLSISRRQLFGIALAVVAGLSAYLIAADLTLAARYTLAIFAVAITLWITEAIPLVATAMVILFLEIILLGLPGGPLGLENTGYRIFLQPLFAPAVVLMLGGIVLSSALNKHGLDVIFAAAVLRVLPKTSGAVLAGFMVVTAFLSMWMSNTAATALMLAILMPALKNLSDDDPLRGALVLSIPFSANLGGMATPVGTPPNAIAIGALSQIGVRIGFLEWIKVSLPLTIVLLIITWLALMRIYPPKSRVVKVNMREVGQLNRTNIFILVILSLTILLWLTTDLHGIPEAAIAIIPIIIFLASRVLERQDFNALDWDVLIVIGGGLSLSTAFEQSGLSDVIVNLMQTGLLPLWQLILLAGTMSVLLSTIISHTAAISLLMPLVISMGGAAVIPVAMGAALASSAGLGLPVSNAPNTLAYSTGLLSNKDMAKCGLFLSFVGTLLITVLMLLWYGGEYLIP